MAMPSEYAAKEIPPLGISPVDLYFILAYFLSAEKPKRYGIIPVIGKGLGIVATQDILPGTRVMAEKPLIHIDSYDDSDGGEAFTDISRCLDAYLKFSQAEQENFMSLHSYIKPSLDYWRKDALANGLDEDDIAPCVAVMAVYEVNCYPAGEGSVVCLEASRLNHSCVPNVMHYWNEAIGRLTIHATKAISAGEELLTSYVEPLLSRWERTNLLEQWGFTCRCAACEDTTSFGKDSDWRREGAKRRDVELNQMAQRRKSRRPASAQILQEINQEAGLLYLEGIENLRMVPAYAYYLIPPPFSGHHFHGFDRRLIFFWLSQ